jgi:hypothetical protein
MAPFTAQRVWPLMKLPGSTVMPCKNQTVPISIRIAPGRPLRPPGKFTEHPPPKFRFARHNSVIKL